MELGKLSSNLRKEETILETSIVIIQTEFATG